MDESRSLSRILPYSPENYPKPLPTFASEEELRDFWDTHDFTYYEDELEAVPYEELPQPFKRAMDWTPPMPRRRPVSHRTGVVVLRLSDDQLRAATEVAAKRHVPVRELVRSWVSSGLERERSTQEPKTGT